MLLYLLKAIEVEINRQVKEAASDPYKAALLNLSKAVKEVMRFW